MKEYVNHIFPKIYPTNKDIVKRVKYVIVFFQRVELNYYCIHSEMEKDCFNVITYYFFSLILLK